MPSLDRTDATTFANMLLDLNLVQPHQLEECLAELGSTTLAAERLLQVLQRKGYITPYQVDRLRKGKRDGYLLGQYKLLYKVASGSFGRVFRAVDTKLNRVAAVKVLRHRWASDPESVQQFHREARLGMTLLHVNIVPIFDVGTDGDYHYIAMEFVEGGNLRDLLRIRKKLQPQEALQFMADIAAALAHALAHGITHRDIKLTNILFSSDGRAKLVDFGLAGIDASGGSADPAEQRTIDYAALESATGVKRGDPRSDLYFVGCVFYQMLSGQAPLTATRDKAERMKKSRFEEITPIGRRDPSLPFEVVKIVERLMCLDPYQRYQDPQSLLDDLRAAQEQLCLTSAHGSYGGVFASPSGAATAQDGTSPPAQAPTLIFVEPELDLQNVVRSRLGALGYRVLIMSDVLRAAERLRSDPVACLILDIDSIGGWGMKAFLEKIVPFCSTLAARGQTPPATILLMDPSQAADWASRIPPDARAMVLVKPVTLRQLREEVERFAPLEIDSGEIPLLAD